MKKITINFEFHRETSGIHNPIYCRYQEIVPENEESSIPNIYVKKGAFGNKTPNKIQIILTY